MQKYSCLCESKILTYWEGEPRKTQTMKKEVAESCFDLLHHSMVEHFSAPNRVHADKDLEGMGFTVGGKLVEKYVRDRQHLFADELDVITFLCKDFWAEVYGKQMDKLRTNHKGVFELQDHRFRAVLRVSTGPDANALEAAKRQLLFPSGMIRGALAGLGVVGTVRADVTGLPGVTFVINVDRSGSGAGGKGQG